VSSASRAGDTGAPPVVADPDPAATVQAWRERGAHGFDPVRFRFIEALARRAAAQGGAARRLLDARVARLLAAYGDDLERAAAAQGTAGDGASPPAAKPAPSPRGPLAQLVEHIARQASAHGEGDVASRAVPASELKTLHVFRSTWSRLSADRRLAQSLAKVPENAGPLHSHHLVHRSLTLMRDLSPEYLARFMSHVDALLWLDQAHAATAGEKDVPRGNGDRKAARGGPSARRVPPGSTPG